jgi:hypothetical protein
MTHGNGVVRRFSLRRFYLIACEARFRAPGESHDRANLPARRAEADGRLERLVWSRGRSARMGGCEECYGRMTSRSRTFSSPMRPTSS